MPAFLLGLVLLSGSCPVAVFAAPSGDRSCNAAAAERLVGRRKPSDVKARRLTHATIVRQIAPGAPVTEDYRTNRVTIETDPATGRVVRARCG